MPSIANKSWVRVAATTDFVVHRPIVITAAFRSIAVYLLEDNQYYAIENSCTHQGLPLDQGPCFDGIVECPFHGARFSIKTGAVLAPPAFCELETFEVRVYEGYVEVGV